MLSPRYFNSERTRYSARVQIGCCRAFVIICLLSYKSTPVCTDASMCCMDILLHIMFGNTD